MTDKNARMVRRSGDLTASAGREHHAETLQGTVVRDWSAR